MECECELKQEEIKVLRSIFGIVLQFGRSPTVKELQLSLKKSEKGIISLLQELERKDLLLRKKRTQEIIAIYPLSLTPTGHEIIMENGIKLFAMCAVDALGMPIMFNRNVEIMSQCEKCKQEIIIKVTNGEIRASHPDTTICSLKRQTFPAAETCCPLVNFFCSRKHAEEWILENPTLKKKINQISLEQAFPRIKRCWKQYGKLLGFIKIRSKNRGKNRE